MKIREMLKKSEKLNLLRLMSDPGTIFVTHQLHMPTETKKYHR